MKYLDRHPAPWAVDEKIQFDRWFVNDANGKTIVSIGAYTEEVREEVRDGELLRISVKRETPGAQKLAQTIAAIPAMLAAILEAHATLAFEATGVRREASAEQLEKFIEQFC